MKTKKSVMEIAVYGLIGAIYTSLFFFGALYPQFGFSSAGIGYEKSEESLQDENGTEQEIVYKSLFLERLKEWL